MTIPQPPLVPLALPSEVAAYLGVAVSTLSAWRAAGQGPWFVRTPGGRFIRYDWVDVTTWASEHRR